MFIDGDPNLLPWLHRSEKLLVLMRMIDTTNKLVFAVSCGMQSLVYLKSCSHPIKRVVNGHGKGGSLRDIHQIRPEELRKLGHDEVVLDNATGDVYQYDHGREEFTPVGNVGLHCHRAAQDDWVARSAMVKTEKYVAQAVDSAYPIYMGKQNEAKCYVLKPCNQHWLVHSLGLQPFLVPQHNLWDMHPVNITSALHHYFILAESHRGPQIITYNEHAVGVQFRIDPKYQETVKVLRNFVDHILAGFEQEEVRRDLPLAMVRHMGKTVGVKGNNAKFSAETSDTRPDTAKSRSGPRPTTASTIETTNQRPVSAISARHSGFAFSRRYHVPLIVSNNATTDVAITAKKGSGSESPGTVSHNITPIRMRNTGKSTNFTMQISPIAANSPISVQEKTNSEKTGLNTLEYQSILTSTGEKNPVLGKKQTEIRCFLHPRYRVSDRSRSNSSLTPSKRIIRIKTQRIYHNKAPKSVDFGTFCKSKTTFYPYLGLTIANDGQVYRDPQAKQREEERNSRKKWVSERDFEVKGGKSQSPAGEIANYVRLTPSEPPGKHVFREESKGKWIAGQFKVAGY